MSGVEVRSSADPELSPDIVIKAKKKSPNVENISKTIREKNDTEIDGSCPEASWDDYVKAHKYK